MNRRVSLIKIENSSLPWKEAIKKGVSLLVNANIATNELADSIIENTEKLGPYYVLMPKVALAHTSPGEYNKKVGMSLIVFKEPIKFSDQSRHDVNLLFTLSAIDGSSHMDIIQKFAMLFSDKELVNKALEASNEEEIFKLFKEIL